MDPITTFQGKSVGIPDANINTDLIVPARFLKMTDRWGLSEALFADWRFTDEGDARRDFVLNRPEMRGRQILVRVGILSFLELGAGG